MRKKFYLLIISFLILLSCCSQKEQIQKELSRASNFSIYIVDSTYQQFLYNQKTDSAILFIENLLADSSLLSKIHISYLFTKLSALELHNNKIAESITSAKYSLDGIKGLEGSNDSLYVEIMYNALMLISKNHFIINKYDKAILILDSLERFLTSNSQAPSSNILLTEVFYWKSLVYIEMGDFSLSKQYCRKGINLLGKHSDREAREADFYSILGEIYIYEEDFEKAEIYQLKALSIIKNSFSDSSAYYAEHLTTLGIYYYESKQFEKSLDCFATAHEIIKDIYPKNSPQYAFIYNNLGDVYCRKGIFDIGISYYDEALRIFKNYGFDQSAKIVIHNLGNAYRELGEHSQAIEYYALSLTYGNNKTYNNSIFPSYTYKQLGNLKLSKNQFQSALNYYNKAIQHLCLFDIDSIYFYKDSLENHLLSEVELLESLFAKGNVELILYENNGNVQLLRNAVESFRRALFLVELIRNKYISEESKLQLNQIQSTLFSKNLISLVELHNCEGDFYLDNELLKAIEYNKHSTLRSLIINDVQLKKSELSLQTINLIDSLQARIRYLKDLSKYAIENKLYDDSMFISINNQLFQCLYDYDSIKNTIETIVPEFNQNYIYNSLSISEIQSHINDSTVIINYGIADSLILIFAITKNGYRIHHSIASEDLIYLREQFLSSIKFSNTQQFHYYGRVLFHVFIHPIFDFIKDFKHLTILPDGEFLSIPFGAFNTESHKDSVVYLIENYSIDYKYSMMLTNDQKTEDNDKYTREYDIVFSGYAPLAINVADKASTKRPSSLAYSGYEIESISSVFKNSMKSTELHFNNKASWNKMIHGLEKSKIFHLASHSYANTQDGDCYIILSEAKANLTGDPLKNILPKNKIFIADIAGANINSDLVTISSCYTGIGESIPGEGMLSLARSFYRGGANNILYSLWNVSDLHTCKFMISFYKYFNRGYSYSTALQKTKVDFINSNLQLPHLWSGFILLN